LGGSGGAGVGGSGGLGGAGGAAAPDWWNTSYQRRARFTIDSPVTLTSLPLRLTLATPDIPVGQSKGGGDDLHVLAADDATELPFEVERWSPQEGTVWVLVPTLPAGSSELFVYFDGPITQASNPDAVWANHSAVYHFSNSTKDSGPLGIDGNDDVGSQAGYAALGGKLTSVSDVEIEMDPALWIAPGAGVSYEAWFARADAGNSGRLFGVGDCCANGFRVAIASDGVVAASVGQDTCCLPSGTPSAVASAALPLGANDVDWHSLVVVLDGAAGGGLQLYLDGELASVHEPLPAPLDSPPRLTLGGPLGTSLTGALDELRVVPRALGVDEVAARVAATRGDFVVGVVAEVAP
jgi:biopolymer transport protein ExbB